MLAPYACHHEQSRGRLVSEETDAIRTAFQRDRDRIVHSTAFRRLTYKTQVFVNHEGDHYRTRLTHSLEVSQIARTLARTLHLNEDLAEALALAHDLGHTPFGHAGEDALHAVMQPYGGFNHNEQTLRILTQLEHRYARFRGLNLTWEMLEGVVKHNGPLTGQPQAKLVPAYILEFNQAFDLQLDTFASLEAQIASLADDIAYTCHDLDDGLRAGMFMVDDLLYLPQVGDIFLETRGKFTNASVSQQNGEALRRLMRLFVHDLLQTTRQNLESLQPTTVHTIRQAPQAVASFSTGISEMLYATRTFLMQRMYRHYRVNRMSAKAHQVITEIFNLYIKHPGWLPTDWQPLQDASETQRARSIANYIAGMTDRYALQEHARLFDVYSGH